MLTGNSKSFRMIAVAFGIWIAISTIFSIFDFGEWWHEWTRTHEAVELDEIIVGLLIASLWYSYKMSRESIQEFRRQAELEREAARQSRQRTREIGQVCGGVAHEFNNLLAVILGNLNLLERSLKDDERLGKRIATATDATRRGSTLTQRLLAFSRRQVLVPQVQNAGDLISGLMARFRRIVEEKIDIRTEFADDLWPVMVDPAQLADSLINLVLNARDAMPEGGRLTISATNMVNRLGDDIGESELTPGQYVVLTVNDTGTGIAEEARAHVFEPFFTTKEVAMDTGLGLSMVDGFVTQSGGHVKVDSAEGEGTTVTLYLPRAEKPVPKTVTASPATAGRPPRGGETVLVVEDDPEVCEVAVALLESLDYRTLRADSGDTALSVFESHPDIDLLLTDVVMPGGMNGTELAAKLRERNPNVKVLFTTGYSADTAFQDSEPDCDHEFLGKPYHKENLARKVRLALAGGDG